MTDVLRLWAGLYSAAEVGATVLDPAPDPIDLLSGTYALEQLNGKPAYEMAQPGLKNGGVWDDPGNRDGREIAFSANTNVTETLTLVATTGDIQARQSALRKLNLFAHWARKYNEDLTTDPKAISIEYSIDGGVGSQYAQIFNMEVAPMFRNGDSNGVPYISGVTLTIERAGGWQGIPIGASPRMWTLEAVRGKLPTNSGSPSGSQYNYTRLDLVEVSPPAGYENAAEKQIYNVCSYGTGSVGSLEDNFVDIPVNLIPGDLDCLAAIMHLPSDDAGGGLEDENQRIYVGLKTNPQNDAGTINIRNTYNGGDATIVNSTGVTMSKVSVGVSSDQGIKGNGSNTTHYYLQFSVGSGAVFPVGSGAAINARWSINPYSMRGAYNVYFRGGTNAGGSTSQMRLVFYYGDNTVGTGSKEQIIGEITPSELTGATIPHLTYVGTLVIPEQGQYQNVASGLGQIASNATGQLRIRAYRSAGTTVTTIRLWDVVLMPYDEGAAILQGAGRNVELGNYRGFILDSTEYFSRQTGGMLAQLKASNALYPIPLADVSGRPILLKPGRINRLYFLSEDVDSGAFTPRSDLGARVIVHPVPRWSGIRDV